MLPLALLLFQSSVPAIPQTEVQRATKPIVIDGKVNEPAWQGAESFTLQFPWAKQTGAKQKTAARLLWDENYLYAAYECDDSEITVQFHNHDDPTYRDDAVEIFLNPKPSQNFYYGLEMNAHAVLYDYAFIWPHMLLQRYDFTGVKLAAATTPKGWSLEVAIPWHNFEEIGGKMPPRVGDVWTANLNRWDGTEPDRRLSVWSDTLQAEPNPHNPARFGRLVFR